MNKHASDVLIIGGGIQGCATAWNLARAGVKVVLLEKDYVARHESGVNAGGVRRLGRHLTEIPLSQRSSELWSTLDEQLGADTGFKPSWQIKVAENESDLRKLTDRVQSVKSLGYDHEQMIDQKTLRDYAPLISTHCLGGILVEGDGSAIPFKTTMAFASAAKKSGADIFENNAVTAIERSNTGWQVSSEHGQFDAQVVVNCAGAWGDKIAAMVGDLIPLTPVALLLMIAQRMPPFLDGVVGAAGRTLSFKQFENGTVLIGGGYKGIVDRDHNKADVVFENLAENIQTACDIFPIMRSAHLVRSWGGIEGVTQDNLPVIDYGSQPGIFHAFGFSAHGFQLGPAVGETLSAMILNENMSFDLTPFTKKRFN